MSTTEKSELINEVFFFLDCHKLTIVQELFPTANEGYKKEWYQLDAFRFWCRLDLANRNRVVEMAQVHYADNRG